jgi:hypothetical protein
MDEEGKEACGLKSNDQEFGLIALNFEFIQKWMKFNSIHWIGFPSLTFT